MKQEFDAKIIKAEDYDGDAAYIEVPFDTKEVYGTRGMIKVKAYFDGYLYRGAIAPMGKGGKSCILARQDVRKAIGKNPGDTVHIVLELDNDRTVEVPDDFAEALAKNPKAQEIFAKFAYTHRKEYVNWITEAKKPETRERRILKAVDMIAKGSKYS